MSRINNVLGMIRRNLSANDRWRLASDAKLKDVAFRWWIARPRGDRFRSTNKKPCVPIETQGCLLLT